MNKTLTIVGGIGLGAGLMYLLDPISGKRRRALLGDKAAHLAHAAEDAVETAARDLNNRAHGAIAKTRTALSKEETDDQIIAARVRARLGRYVSHPHAISASCESGRVTLSGPILASEVEGLLVATWKVHGVMDVVNWLEIHQTPGNIPALQGGRHRSGQTNGRMHIRWTPAARLLAGTVGGGLATYAAFRRGPLAKPLACAGLGMLCGSARGGERKGCCGNGSIST